MYHRIEFAAAITLDLEISPKQPLERGLYRPPIIRPQQPTSVIHHWQQDTPCCGRPCPP